MMKKSESFFLLLAIFTCQVSIFAQPKIVFKFDDIGVSKNVCNAGPVLDYLLEKKIKASYGVIANRLDETAAVVMSKYLAAVDDKGDKLIEIWHHGLTHSNKNPPANNMEFKGTPYQFQKDHLDSGHLLVSTYLGVEMSAFGSPYNATDSTTIRVLSENPHYKVVMFSTVDMERYPQIAFLNNRVDIEKGTGKPDFELFASEYKKHPEYRNSYMVLQAHPPYWTSEHFNQFKKILEFLVNEKCTFVLPHELAKKFNKQ